MGIKLLGFEMLGSSALVGAGKLWVGTTEDQRAYHRNFITQKAIKENPDSDLFLKDIESSILIDSKGVYKSISGDYFKVTEMNGIRCFAYKGHEDRDGEMAYSGKKYCFMINGHDCAGDERIELTEKMCGELF